MTDSQFKELAELVLVNDKRLTLISGLVLTLVEQVVDAAPSGATHANLLRANIDQLSALSRDSLATHAEVRRRFGLDDAA